VTVYVESIATLKLVTRVELPDGTDPETAIGYQYEEDGSPITPWKQWSVIAVTDKAYLPNDSTEYVPVEPDPAPNVDDIMAEFFFDPGVEA
jgi:hypothetical protein